MLNRIITQKVIPFLIATATFVQPYDAIAQDNQQNQPTSTLEQTLSPDQKREIWLNTIDSVISAGVLDPDFAQEYRNTPFDIIEDNSRRYAGSFNPDSDRSALIATSATIAQGSAHFGINYTGTALHEAAHYFFDEKLSDEQKDEFRARIREYENKFSQLQAQINNGEVPDSVFESYGFTRETYANFGNFLDKRNFYEQDYRDFYQQQLADSDVSDRDVLIDQRVMETLNRQFYGTEAFAYIAQGNTNWDTMFLINTIINQPQRPDYRIQTGNIFSTDRIPSDLTQFYSGFFDVRFFE
jgi:hypothetical protein